MSDQAVYREKRTFGGTRYNLGNGTVLSPPLLLFEADIVACIRAFHMRGRGDWLRSVDEVSTRIQRGDHLQKEYHGMAFTLDSS